MSIIDELNNIKIWQKFLKEKAKNGTITDKEKKYIEQKKYMKIANEIINNQYSFNPPNKHIVNKSEKPKAVYTYNKDETMILKLIEYLMVKKYDEFFSPNCYMGRKQNGVRQAMDNLISVSHIEKLCCYKVDIDDYFNTIPVELLLPKLKQILADDEKLYDFLRKILTDKRVEDKGNIIVEEKGVMSGTPISSFLANVYINKLDQKYFNQKLAYARYGKSIIIFCKENELQEIMIDLSNEIYRYQLKLDNDGKELIPPGGSWNFLGFSYQNSLIDLSEETKRRIKVKIRIFARKVRKWMINNNIPENIALMVMNRKFNKQFFEYESGKDFVWYKWFFPIINTTNGIREIDTCMQENLRYIVTGRRNKTNYKYVRYSYLKQCDYKPLLPEFLKTRRII